MAEIEKIGLGGKPILRPTIEPSIETSEEVVKPIIRPKFDASKFLDKIIDLKPQLRPEKEMKVAIAANKAKSDLSIQTLLDKISEAEGTTTKKLTEMKVKDTSPYDAVYGYNLLTPSKSVSSMTLKELFGHPTTLLKVMCLF